MGCIDMRTVLGFLDCSLLCKDCDLLLKDAVFNGGAKS